MTRSARTACLAAAIALLACLVPSAQAATQRPLRDVLVVSNNWAGTADLVDPRSFKRLKRLDVVPDRNQRIADISADPTAKFYYDSIRTLVGEGHDQYVDDGFTSPDGRTVYFSRPSFADVVAISLRTGAIRWRTKVDGYRADHMALSQDGRRLLVSASTAGVIDSIDTRSGQITARIPSGDSPHESNFSRDGSRIFHASIGTVYTDTDDPSEDATKGRRVFEVIDARTNKVLEQIDMGQKLAEAGYPGLSSAVRPMAVTPNERYVFFQVSFLFGIVQYDLRTDKVVDVLEVAARGRQGRGPHRVPARLRAPRSGHEPAGHQALRGRDDVALRRDRDPQAVQVAAHRQGGTRPVLVAVQQGRSLLLRVGRRRGPRRGDLVQDGSRDQAHQGRRPPAAHAHRRDPSCLPALNGEPAIARQAARCAAARSA